MNERMKLAGIAAATVIAAVSLFSYCSPYQTCVRAATEEAMGNEAEFEELEDGLKEALRHSPVTEIEAERNAQLQCALATG